MEVETHNNKWVAGPGTTALSIIGTAAGGLSLLGGGLGSGLLGGNQKMNCHVQDEIMTLKSEVAKLQSEKYTDEAVNAQRTREAAINEKVYGFIIEQDKKIAGIQKEIGCLQKQIELQNKYFESELKNQANLTTIGFNNVNGAVQSLVNTISGFTKVVVPSSAVCNTSNNGCCNSSVQQ